MKTIEQQLTERLEVYRTLEEPSVKEEAWLSLKRLAERHNLNIDTFTRSKIDTSKLSDYELRNLFY